MTTKRICRVCNKEFKLTKHNFYFSGGYFASNCRECHNKENWKNYGKKASARQKIYDKKIRFSALQAYSGKYPKCSCCDESIIEFLGIDHIDGGGSIHRKELTKLGTTLYLWLRKNNYPNGYQVLCHNCNLAKGFYGVCPHKIIN